MKTNEDFLKWLEEEKGGLALIEAMKPEYQPEYYLRKGYFAHNDELERLKDMEKDLKLVASLILTTGYTLNEEGHRVMDANEYMWIDRACNILKKYHKKESK